MSPDTPDPEQACEPDDPATAAALDWFVRLRDAPVTLEDRAAFARWREADPAHAEAYAEVEALWAAADALPAPLPVPHAWADAPAEPARRPRRRWVAGGIAASLLVALAGPQLWIAAIADARTGTAEIRDLALADGSRVWLDADSAIDVAIDADRRHIRLLRGRAWFSVTHEARPFTVALGDAQIRDIGTAFEVTRRSDGGDVTVTEGLVELTAAGGRAMRLAKGQAARIDAEGRSRLVQPASTPVAWRQGRMQFVGAPLGDVLDDLARHGAGRPLMMDPALARRRITGAVDLTHPEAARDAVLARVGARARRVGPWLLVSQR